MKSTVGFSIESILEQLDKYALRFDFPVLNNMHLRLGDARLSSFVSTNDWLIVFEILVFDVRSYEFLNQVYGYGNRLAQPGFQKSIVIFEQADDALFEDDNGNSIVDVLDFSILIFGERHRFAFSKKDYETVGLVETLPMEPETKILRMLCSHLEGQFFLEETELPRLLEQSDLKLFLQLENWSHPDVAGGELPGQNECLQSFALALSQRNPAAYICSQDQRNTHWSNWIVPPVWQ